MIIGIVVALLLGIFVLYLLPSAILHYASENKFGAAFRLSSVFKKAFKSDYLVAWLVSLLYTVLLGAILSYIPIVGSAISSFVTGITGISLLAEAFAKK